MIEGDLAELVDEHGGVPKLRRGQELLQEGGLAAPEEACDDVDGDGSVIAGHRAYFPSCLVPESVAIS